ncbi:unnamed protein product [Boreogadus saida]
MCADTDHRDHRIVPLSKEAARSKVGKISASAKFTEITNYRFCAEALEFLFKFFRDRNYNVMEKHSLHICNCLMYVFPRLSLRLSPQGKLNKQLFKLTRAIRQRTLRPGGDLVEAKGLEEAGGLGEAVDLDLQQRKTFSGTFSNGRSSEFFTDISTEVFTVNTRK